MDDICILFSRYSSQMFYEVKLPESLVT